VWREIYAPTLSYILRECGRLRARRKQAQCTRRVSLHAYLRCFVMMPRKWVLLRRYGLPSIR
jgi:hypothetical protein